MPRKTYVGKNQFCPNSRQSEWNYLRVLYYWLKGCTFSNMTEIMRDDEDHFDRVMQVVNSGPTLSIEKTEFVEISRQSLHNIINNFSSHLLDYDKHSSFYYIRNYINKPNDDLVDKPVAINSMRNRISALIPKAALISFFKRFFQKNHLHQSGDFVWKLSSGEIDNSSYRKNFKIASPEALFDQHLIAIMRKRFYDFRGFDRKKMTSHVAYFLIMIKAIKLHNREHEITDKEFF